MYKTRDEIIKFYPKKWVVLHNVQFADEYHQAILGGEVIAAGDTLEELYAGNPDINLYNFTIESTWTDEEAGKNAAFIYPT